MRETKDLGADEAPAIGQICLRGGWTRKKAAHPYAFVPDSPPRPGSRYGLLQKRLQLTGDLRHGPLGEEPTPAQRVLERGELLAQPLVEGHLGGQALDFADQNINQSRPETEKGSGWYASVWLRMVWETYCKAVDFGSGLTPFVECSPKLCSPGGA